ncbi:hypothetical protein Q9R38_26145 [Priestia aryabhattai]|uniref:hypothetical protein n=1 Tax=Priestia aryabhattai TaxID=412384 RepID=UPI0028822FBA|nr:hypothetical protein [Priestia aryabhattai]MDT0150026.1 hypothetical protein [Priestia aryabhattai]MDT0155596.1 hypothetical protein [Priestia aryabhattai]
MMNEQAILNKMTIGDMIKLQEIQFKHEQAMARIEAEKEQGESYEIELEMEGIIIRMDTKDFDSVMKTLKRVGE